MDRTSESLEKQEDKLKRGISRLIDSYAQEHINKNEFEPRIKGMKQHLKMIEEQKKKIIDQKNLKKELTLVAARFEGFASCVETKLENLD